MPLLLRTLPMMRSVPGATPVLSLLEAAPVPAMVEATWVPCPCGSVGSSSGTKLTVSWMWSARSGWVGSMPVSRTATVTPSPS